MPKSLNLLNWVYTKITISNNFMEIWIGGEVFDFWNLDAMGRDAQAAFEFQVERMWGGGGGDVPSIVGGWIFSGITH